MIVPGEFLREMRAHAKAMAAVARAETLKYFRQSYTLDNKLGEAFDPVTTADLAAEKAMRAYISAHRPYDGILGEEFGAQAGTTGFTWVLDPIDGTRSFVAGIPTWTTLIGLVDRDNKAILGLIDQPYVNETYIGWGTGAGAKLGQGDSAALKISSVDSLDRAIIATTDPYIFSKKMVLIWQDFTERARISRYSLDGYAYALLASGQIDLIVEEGLKPHDVAALLPVVLGAGGIVVDWTGAPANLESQNLIAASSIDLAQNVANRIKEIID